MRLSREVRNHQATASGRVARPTAGAYRFRMIFGEGVLGIALLFLWIFCIFDVISSEPELVRNLPKLVWLLIVIIIPDVGSIAWLILGRPRGAALSPGATWSRPQAQKRSAPGPVGPEDSPHFLKSIDEQRRLKAWEDDLRRREDELRNKDEDNT